MLVVGIAGGSGSGKTTFAKQLTERLSKIEVSILTMDSYYKDHSHIPAEKRREINFDHPDTIDFDLLVSHISKLKQGIPVDVPEYSFIESKREKDTIKLYPQTILILEGILIFVDETLRNLIDIKVFIESRPDDQLLNILRRDIYERGRNSTEVIRQYETNVRPMYQEFVEPSRKYADFIIPINVEREISLNFITNMTKNHLLKRMK